MIHTRCPLLRTLIPALLLPLLFVGCGASAKNETEEAPKMSEPERVLREFYTALGNDQQDEARALLTQRAKLTDPKGGSLLGNTASSISANEGIADFNVLKVGEETLESVDGPDGGTEELRTVTIEFEITFNNGESRRSESRLIYEALEKPEGSPPDAPQEFGWRVEAIRAVWEEGAQ